MKNNKNENGCYGSCTCGDEIKRKSGRYPWKEKIYTPNGYFFINDTPDLEFVPAMDSNATPEGICLTEEMQAIDDSVLIVIYDQVTEPVTREYIRTAFGHKHNMYAFCLGDGSNIESFTDTGLENSKKEVYEMIYFIERRMHLAKEPCALFSDLLVHLLSLKYQIDDERNKRSKELTKKLSDTFIDSLTEAGLTMYKEIAEIYGLTELTEELNKRIEYKDWVARIDKPISDLSSRELHELRGDAVRAVDIDLIDHLLSVKTAEQKVEELVEELRESYENTPDDMLSLICSGVVAEVTKLKKINPVNRKETIQGAYLTLTTAAINLELLRRKELYAY